MPRHLHSDVPSVGPRRMRMTIQLRPDALHGVAPFLGAGGPECFEKLFAQDVARATGMLPSRVNVLSLKTTGDAEHERHLVTFELSEARVGEIPLLDDCVKELTKQGKDPKSALLAGRITRKLDVGFTPIRAPAPMEDHKTALLRHAALKAKGQLEIRNAENAQLKAQLSRLEAKLGHPSPLPS